jgi:hypothetical protein
MVISANSAAPSQATTQTRRADNIDFGSLRLRSAENKSFEILKQPDPLVGSSLGQH